MYLMTERDERTEFLLARIAEDEAVAREAINPARPGTHWQWEIPDASGDPDAPRWLRTTEEFPTTYGVGTLPAFPLGFEFKAEPSRGMAHIARHDPARVLAECEAKRQIVQHLATLIADADRDPRYEGTTACANMADQLLEMLVLPYADHPDWREEWRP